MAHIIVVGGGIGGLAAAWRLQSRGHSVAVLEREASAGGRMRSEHHHGYVIDRGAQFIASGYTNLHALAAEVGLSQEVCALERPKNAILRDGVLHPGDYDAPLVFLKSRLISTATKLRLPRLLWETWRHRRHLDPMQPQRAAHLDGDDLPTYLRRIVGDEALEYLISPALSSTFDSDPEDLSGAFCLLALSFVQSGFRLQSFRSGTGALTRTLAARLDTRTGARVVDVSTDSSGARVILDDGTRLQADAAVVSVPGPLVSGICSTLTEAERRFFGCVRYVAGTIVFLLLDKAPSTLPYYGVAFPRREGMDLYGLAVDHHKPGAAPVGAGLLNTALTAAAAKRTWDWPDDRIVDLVLDNLARTPIGRLRPAHAQVHRWDPMLPQFYAGYLPRLAAFLKRGERSPRLAFAGDYLVGPYTEAALTSGLRAADEIALG